MDETLLRAYEGKSASRGGLNAKAFKDRLIEQYPKKAKKIRACKTRGDLIECCTKDRNIYASIKRAQKNYSAKSPRRVARRTARRTRSPPRTPVLRARSPADPEESENSDCGCSMSMAPKTPKDYFKPNTNLSGKKQRFCRCVAHMAEKNPASCYGGANPEWKKGAKSRGCMNPYAICAKSVGTTSRCYDQYDFRKIPASEVKALRRLHGKR